MAKRRLFKILSAVAKIKPGEERTALLLFAYFFLITAPYYIIKSVRDASFIEDLGVNMLPYAYATALIIGLVVALQARLQARLSRRALLQSTLAFFILTALGFEWLFATFEWKWLSLGYWFWANVFVVVLTTQFWMVINDLLNPRDAKRLIGFFGSGGILGGVVGGLLAGILARLLAPHLLLFFVCAFLIACLAVVRGLTAPRSASETEYPRNQESSERRAMARGVGFKDCYRSVRQNGYLRLLAAGVLIAGVVSTFIDWQSKNIIAGAAGSNLVSFFGFFNAGLNVLALLLQLVLTSRFIERFGLRFGLLVYPLIMFLGTAGIALWPVLIMAMSLKGGDKALSYSIQQSSRELLYIPVPPEVKYKAKIFIDMFVNRLAKAVGAVILLGIVLLPIPSGLSEIVGGRDPHLLLACVVSGIMTLGWVALNFRISSAYLREVKDKLANKWERGDGIVDGLVDVGRAGQIFDALESRRHSPELFALHLFELARDHQLTPDVQRLLARSGVEVGPSLTSPLLDGEEMPWLPEYDGPLVPAALDKEISEIFALDSYQGLMASYTERIMDGTGAGVETARMELAKALGLMDRRSPLIAKLGDLLDDNSPKVFQYASASAGRLRRKEFLPALIRHLASAATRHDALAALENYGPSIAGTLADCLLDRAEPEVVRIEAARLLGQLGTKDAAVYLLDALGRERDGLEKDILDALDRVRSGHPEVALPAAPVLAHFAEDIAKTKDVSTGVDLLHLFMLLGLIYDHEDVFRAYHNVLRNTKDAVAYAIELLDLIVCPEVKERLFPLLESLPAGKETA